MENKDTRRVLGDYPVGRSDDDKLAYSDYAQALTEFVKTCDTPMTIAIQGDWGLGKTSVMKMMQKNLSGNEQNDTENNSEEVLENTGDDQKTIETVWINTWESAQLGNGDNLDILFLSEIIECVSGEEKTANDSLSIIKKFGKFLGMTTAIGVDSFIGNRAGDTVEKLVDRLLDGTPQEPCPSIKNIRNEFKNVIESKNNRVIFFVDDLDRLNPEKAVELLEVLKNFLDCPNCVFVLAIDYSVVIQGVKAKYPHMDDRKAELFFHKIIQVPYMLPKNNEKIDSYVCDLLQEIGIQPGNIEEWSKLIASAGRNNPREIKRLINLIKLQDCIYRQKEKKQEKQTGWEEKEEQKEGLLIAILGLQIFDNALYDDVVNMDLVTAKKYFSDNAENDFLNLLANVINKLSDEKLWKLVTSSSRISNQNNETKEEHKKYYAQVEYDSEVYRVTFIPRGQDYRGDKGILAFIVNLLKEKNVDDWVIIQILEDNDCVISEHKNEEKISVNLKCREKGLKFKDQSLKIRDKVLDRLIRLEPIRGYIVDDKSPSSTLIRGVGDWICPYLEMEKRSKT